MKVPEVIILQVKSSGSVSVGELIVQLKVLAGRKNPYFIHFPKTDSAGHAQLTREDFIGQFKDHWESGLMDYAGTPESAAPTVDVSLFDPSWLIENRSLAMAWPLLTHEKTKWKSKNEQYRYKASCRNPEYQSGPVVADLSRTNEIVLQVRAKQG